jgi:hypothetical protein
MMDVMIGVDPHKRSHTATMLDRGQRELRQITVRAGRRQLAELLAWADGVTPRTWAVDSGRWDGLSARPGVGGVAQRISRRTRSQSPWRRLGRGGRRRCRLRG